MAKKNIKIYYFYALENVDKKDKIVDLTSILEGLNDMPANERILNDGEGNIQLKKIDYDEDFKRWYLAFLRNQIDAPFKTKLDDDIETAETLEDDEFVGQECCVIYDEKSKILSLQNNRGSISFSGLRQFLIKYTSSKLVLSAITYKEKYCEISEQDFINYKSIIIGYTDISELIKIAEKEDNTVIQSIGNLANNISALNGKIELSVGRSNNYLQKSKLKTLVDFFKKNPKCTKNLKVKMLDVDTIRMIDLLNNKVNDEITISITKDDPKTFTKIFNAMDAAFDSAISETFDKCNIFVNC